MRNKNLFMSLVMTITICLFLLMSCSPPTPDEGSSDDGSSDDGGGGTPSSSPTIVSGLWNTGDFTLTYTGTNTSDYHVVRRSLTDSANADDYIDISGTNGLTKTWLSTDGDKWLDNTTYYVFIIACTGFENWADSESSYVYQIIIVGGNVTITKTSRIFTKAEYTP